MSLRRMGKRMVERALRLARGNTRRMAGQRLILAYHNVVPQEVAGQGDQSLHLPFPAFCRQLDLLDHHCELVSLTDLLTSTAPSSRPRVALTFDDAYAGAVDLALPELSRRKVPVTMFLTPGLFGASGFWWDRLATLEGTLQPAVRMRALDRDAGRADLVMRSVPAAESVQLPPAFGCAGEMQVRTASALGNVAFGAHTWTHPNLARLNESMVREELDRPLAWLRGSGLSFVPYLAYPYGLFSPAVEAATAQAGYTAGFRVDGGWLPGNGLRPYAIPRYNVPAGLSDDGLQLRLSGALPAGLSATSL